MKYTRLIFVIVPLLLLSVAVCKADSISGSGSWGPDTPITTESAPGDTWSFSFDISDPVTDASLTSLDGFVTEQFTDFTYLLNGSPVAVTLTSVAFYPGVYGGLFDLNLSDGNIVSFYGDQVFGGTPPPDMTFLPDVYPADVAMNDGVLTGSGSVTISTSSSSQVPEPGSLALLALGMVAFGFARKKLALT